ncbi:hypothetical protein M5X00_24150 [Paenibacillus alvei]|uniref:Uncharacterized protein n=1 Tax=Paenibacillus alvei TaxID=44250 RepID=A0ABT4GRS9_PAEAL|nr:hypothetical protein [Paenibacillus alvei]MCY9757322.1 hypothetical protein [Paenibacillus alvei]MCY9759147.1 hypothetical protein [Paenibacillus alvei]MCY9770394.1 hypothetical protein [Paenibacillus alvei]
MKMKVKNIVSIATSVVLLFSLVTPTFAERDAQAEKVNNYVIGSDALSFLEAHNVDVTPFEKTNASSEIMSSLADPTEGISKTALYNESILSLEQEAAANNFTDDQIQKYVKGMVDTTPTIINTPNTTVFNASIVSPPPYSVNRPLDDGLGYEVTSDSAGYNMTTAYAIIPSMGGFANVDKTSGYMFWSTHNPSGNFYMDMGIWYGYGNGGYGWRGVYNTNDPSWPQLATTGIIPELVPGKEVYMKNFIRSDGYAELVVIDANNFSNVLADFYFYVGDRGIYPSNANFTRQITLCQTDKNFSNGAYMNNAQFSQAYLYNSNGYARVSPYNTTTDRGVFGTNSTNVSKVTVNSYTQWDSESVNIRFN